MSIEYSRPRKQAQPGTIAWVAALVRVDGSARPVPDLLYDKDGKGPQRFGGVRIPEDGSVWLHLQMADGKAGWMSAELLGWGS